MSFIDYLIANHYLTEENQGERFERETYEKLETWLQGIADTEVDINKMFAALRRVDATFTKQNVAEIHRAGKADKRPSDIEESGGVIADLIFIFKDGSQRFVSIKHESGSTFAGLGGITDLIDPETLTINRSSYGAQLLVDAGADLNTVQQGYRDRAAGLPTTYATNVQVSIPIQQGTQLYRTIKHGWGQGYIYLREDPKDPTGWFSMKVDQRAHARIFSGLRVYEISYPHNRGKGSKQMTIFFSNDLFSYELEIRNKKTGELPKTVNIRIR